MDILIIGGTVFLGRALVQAAQQAGHSLTLFNRGVSSPEAFPGIETIIGERSTDLSRLAGRRWDAVIDTCGYFPRQVRHSAQALAESVGRYVFISSVSVYADTSQPGVDESGAVGTLQNENVEEITGETYGPLKALCEQAAEAELPGRVLIIRPGLIVGPYDRSDRFTYWPWRVDCGGQVLAPGRPERGLQFIDVRDLAEWTLALIEQGATGIYNADGLPENVSLGELLETCQEVSGSVSRFTWVDEAFLLENQVGPWMEMPLWIPESDPQAGGFFAISVAKAAASGLRYRPLRQTIADTLSWARTRPVDYKWRAGMSAAREAELLHLWEKR
ncbi:MAG: NAD-dependent epimerase/dehydratase family protein [Anaerolineales bacterium]|nr:NAD-dependent epimerase/dehydratase family protein [Anaerolineales bacterium]